MEIFDFDKRWDEVLPLLDRPIVTEALNIGMEAFCRDNRHSIPWDERLGPWWYFGDEDHQAEWTPFFRYAWCDRVDDYYQLRQEQQIPNTPAANTPDWYRCWRACHCLVGWNCAIGQLLMPGLDWMCVAGGEHSTAFGHSEDVLICVDILCGHNCTPEAITQAIKPIGSAKLESQPLWQWLVNMKSQANPDIPFVDVFLTAASNGFIPGLHDFPGSSCTGM